MRRAATLLAVLVLGGFYLAVLWLGRHPRVDELYRLYYVENRLMFWNQGEGIDYRPGERLTFDRKLPYVSRQGWSHPEDWGTWSAGPASELLLRLEGEAGVREVVVEGEPFLAPAEGIPRLTMSLTVNGHPAGSHTLVKPDPTVLHFAVPAGAIDPDELLVLRFSYASAASGQDAEAGTPAFGFVALTLH